MDHDREIPSASGMSANYDFGTQPPPAALQAVPPGTYLCRVDEVRPGVTRTGHQRWALKFVVVRGAEAGRIAAWDGMTFSPKAAARTQRMLASFGLPHTGKVEVEATELIGRVVWVTVHEDTYRHPETGEIQKRNRVPFDGIRAPNGAQVSDEDEDPSSDADATEHGEPSSVGEDIPF